jgi:hypothetical protein
VTFSSGAVVDSLVIEEKATATVSSGATVKAATVAASDVKISGAGKLTAVTVTEDAKSGVEIRTSGTKVTVDPDAGAVTTNSGKIEPGKTSTTTGTGSGSDVIVSNPYTPQVVSKYTMVTKAGVSAETKQNNSAGTSYTVKLTGAIAADTIGDFVPTSGDFFDGFGSGVKPTGKTGLFGSVTLNDFLPVGTTKLKQVNNFGAWYTTEALSSNPDLANDGSYKEKTYTVTVADTLTILLWSGAQTKVITITINDEITVTIDYSALVFNYTATDNLTVTASTTLTVPTGSTLTIPSGKTLTVSGTLTVNGTLTVGGTLEAKGAVEGFTVNAGGKIDIASGGVADIDPDSWLNYTLSGTINAVKGASLSFDGNNIVGNTGSDSTSANDTTFVLNAPAATLSVTGTTYTIGGGSVSLKQFGLWKGYSLVINQGATLSGWGGSTLSLPSNETGAATLKLNGGTLIAKSGDNLEYTDTDIALEWVVGTGGATIKIGNEAVAALTSSSEAALPTSSTEEIAGTDIFTYSSPYLAIDDDVTLTGNVTFTFTYTV